MSSSETDKVSSSKSDAIFSSDRQASSLGSYDAFYIRHDGSRIFHSSEEKAVTGEVEVRKAYANELGWLDWRGDLGQASYHSAEQLSTKL